MKKLIVVLVIVALVLPASLAFAAGKAGQTGFKVQGPNDVDAPRGFTQGNKTTFGSSFGNPIPPGWSKGPKASFLHDPNIEPRGFDKGKGFGFGPKP